MSKHRPAVTLHQIDELCAEAEGIVAGLTLETLLTDRVRTRAWERVLEVIGEAIKRLPEALHGQYPAVDWKAAAGMRDWIVHGYDGVDHLILWRATKEKLPALKTPV